LFVVIAALVAVPLILIAIVAVYLRMRKPAPTSGSAKKKA
jgi:hypothetical protein